MQRRSNTDEFIRRAKAVHGDRYDYSRVEYINARTLVLIICPIHESFWQSPSKHLQPQGCARCGHHPDWRQYIQDSKEKKEILYEEGETLADVIS